MPKAKAPARARRVPAPRGGAVPRPRRARGSRGGAPAAAAAPGTGAGAAGGRGRPRRAKAAKAVAKKQKAAETSAYTGVRQEKKTGRWRADIQHDKRRVYVGTFRSEEEAARAYDRVAIHLRKKTGLNFPAADYEAEAEQLRGMDRQALLAQLRRAGKGGTSQYRGVHLDQTKGKWVASIRDETGKKLHLGYFQREEQAARAYDRAAIKLNNEKAVLNFPLPEYEGEREHLARISTEDLVAELRRQGTGITQGDNEFRGVTYREKTGRWEAEIWGLLGRKKNTHLGTFETGE